MLWKPSDDTLPGWGEPLGARGAARLAHRVLGHEPRLPGRDPRHPRRRPSTWSSPTTRTRSRRASAPAPGPAVRPPTGCTTAGSPSRVRRCRSRSANFITIRDALAEAPGEVIRLVLLSAHYRHPDGTGATDAASPQAPCQPGPPLHCASQRGRLRRMAWKTPSIPRSRPRSATTLNTPKALAALHRPRRRA